MSNYYLLFSFIIGLNILGFIKDAGACNKSPTTFSGSLGSKTNLCSGDLIFEDNFDSLDSNKWLHENTLSGGGNWEFQWYSNDKKNSFTKDGSLHIKPTLTSDVVGESFLTSGTITIPANECTDSTAWGCQRTGTATHVLNPIRSARLRTTNSFSFKYGKVEFRARLPLGEWLWPALWLMPKDNAYGNWPASGEIDVMEYRGNKQILMNGINIGSEQMGSTLHFGPKPELNAFSTSHFTRNSPAGKGFDQDFHRYQLEWTPTHIKFSVDDVEIGKVPAGNGFWERGNFPKTAPNMQNIWKNGEKMAPFDKQFYLIINLAIGGINYFPDGAQYKPNNKPWKNNSPAAATDFWKAKNQWLPTWNNDKSSLVVDYVRVYAI